MTVAVGVILVCAFASPSAAQLTHRLKGSLKSEAGAVVASATIRAEAIAGFRGEQFAGAKDLSVTTSDKGEWNMLGIASGLWLFSTTATDMLPAVLVLPVKFSQRQQVSAVGNSLTFALPLYTIPASECPLLKEALALLAAGKKAEAAQALTVGLGADVPTPTRVAAGEIALLLQQHGLARALFNEVVSKEPKHPRALVGLTSAALMERDWESAGKLMWTARDLAPRDQRPALAAAISDLQQIARIQ
jgi:hypothetical protein